MPPGSGSSASALLSPSSRIGLLFSTRVTYGHSVVFSCIQPLLPEQPIPCIKSRLRKCLGRLHVPDRSWLLWHLIPGTVPAWEADPQRWGPGIGLVACLALSAMLSSLASDSGTPNPQCARASLKETSTSHHDAEPGESRASGLLPQAAPPLSHCPRNSDTVKNSPSSRWRASRIKMVNSGPSCLHGSLGEAKRF